MAISNEKKKALGLDIHWHKSIVDRNGSMHWYKSLHSDYWRAMNANTW
jgi:hypothetical protein